LGENKGITVNQRSGVIKENMFRAKKERERERERGGGNISALIIYGNLMQQQSTMKK